MALLPGDCPLLDPRELDKMLTGVPDPYVAVIPDRHGTGTNALVLAPPSAIVPSFGEGSKERHVEAARAAGIPYAVEELPSLGLDLDTPADIVALTTRVEMQRRREADREGAGDMNAGTASGDGGAPESTGGAAEMRVRPVLGLPEIAAGDPLGALIAERAGDARRRRRRSSSRRRSSRRPRGGRGSSRR